MKKVSVIVPVYKVEKYLTKCLDSLVNQTLKDIEIIIINDGSPDNCQKIIDEYVLKYPNIKSYIKENGGLGSARNYGLQYADGEYIGFVDSDDYVEENMYELLYNKAKQENADYVTCDLTFKYEDYSKKDHISYGMNNIVSDYHKAGLLSPLYAWNKLYKKEILINNNLKFSEGLWYEDLPVTTILFALSNNIGYVNMPLYNYLQRNGSIMNSSYNEKMNDIFISMNKVYDAFNSRNLLNEYYDEIEYLFAEHLMIYGAYRFLRTDHYQELLDKSLKLINEKFPNWRKNKYLKKIFNLKNKLFYKTINRFTFNLWKMIITRRDKN